jgi:hypothetical protein
LPKAIVWNLLFLGNFQLKLWVFRQKTRFFNRYSRPIFAVPDFGAGFLLQAEAFCPQNNR